MVLFIDDRMDVVDVLARGCDDDDDNDDDDDVDDDADANDDVCRRLYGLFRCQWLYIPARRAP